MNFPKIIVSLNAKAALYYYLGVRGIKAFGFCSFIEVLNCFCTVDIWKYQLTVEVTDCQSQELTSSFNQMHHDCSDSV